MRCMHRWVCLSGALVGGCGLSLDLDRLSFESALVPPDAAERDDAAPPKGAATSENAGAPDGEVELDGGRRDGGSSPSVLVARFDHHWFNRGQPPCSVTETGAAHRRLDVGGSVQTRYGGTVVLEADGIDPSDCASAGFAVTGAFTGQPALASAGDVDGDGFDDVLIGNRNSTGRDNGAAYAARAVS